MSNHPYRSAAPTPIKDTSTFPRLIFERDKRRLIQRTADTFVIEERVETKDALGAISTAWIRAVELDHQLNVTSFWLAVRLAELMP